MAEHSILPPSSAARRMACPGSRALEALYPPDEPSKSAREGDAAHWVAAEMLAGRIHQVNNFASNGELVTQEMIDGAYRYTSVIAGDCRDDFNLNTLHIEERVNISAIHPDCWGTPDCWLVKDEALYVYDYKFGHTPVEVFENWQLLEYAVGIVSSLDIAVSVIVLTIIQPRAYHKDGSVRQWVLDSEILGEYGLALKAHEHLSMSPEAPTQPSSECKNCKARHACSALQQSALSVIDMTADSQPRLLSASTVGRELRLLRHAKKLLDARITGIEEQAVSYIRSGANVPFFTLEPGRSSRVWKVPQSTLATLQELLDIPLLKTEAAITPTQAKAAGVPEDILNEYSEIRSGAVKLAEDDGKKAREIFGGNKT